MVGLIEYLKLFKKLFYKPNQSIALIGRFRPTLSGSEYLKEVLMLRKENSELSLEDELNLQTLVLRIKWK